MNIDNSAFDVDGLYQLLTDDDNADTYQRVLEEAIEYQREVADSDLWQDYDTAGFDASDVGARGWELPQLAGTRVIAKSANSNSGTTYRLGRVENGEWVHHHEDAAKVLEAAKQDERPSTDEDGESAPAASLDDVDPEALFTDVVGYEEEKKFFRRTIERGLPVHHLMVGPPGAGKTMFLDDIIERVPGARRVVFTGNQSTAQGVVDILKEHRPTVLVVEEIEKGDKSDREALMTLCGNGYIQETKGDGRGGEVIELDTIVFAAGNDRDSITPESLVDRFTVWPFERYSKEEFQEVCRGVLPRETGVSEEMAEHIATQMYVQQGSTRVRDAEDLAALADSKAEVEQLVDLVVS